MVASIYLNWAEYLSWRDPRIASWDQYQLPDPRRGNFATGLEFSNGTPKALYYAYRMPVFMPVKTAAAGQALELWGGVRPAGYAQSVTHRPQSVAIEFHARGGSGFNVLRRITLSGPHGYFDTRIVVPSTGIISLGWAYPDGSAIHSRIVNVTIR